MPVLSLDYTLRERVADDLRGVMKGEVLADALSLDAYSCDASVFQVPPLLAVIPASEADVCALARYAHQNKIPLIPRGAGTSTSGAALGDGIVVDLSHGFGTLVFLPDHKVHLGCSVPLEQLCIEAEAQEYRVPCLPDQLQHTVGGWLSSDPGGQAFLGDGYLRNWVEAIRVVLDDGSTAWVGNVPAEITNQETPTRLGIIHDHLAELHAQPDPDWQLMRKTLALCHGSYNLLEALHRENHWKSWLGAEGSLGIILEAIIRLPVKESQSTWGIACFPSSQEALAAAKVALRFQPLVCDIYDHRLLSLARSSDILCSEWVHPESMAGLLICLNPPEKETNNSPESLKGLWEKAGITPLRVYWSQKGEQPTPRRIHEIAFKAIRRLKGAGTFLPILGDVAVPSEKLEPFLERLPGILQEHDATVASVVRPGSGSIQLHVLGDIQSRPDTTRLWAVANSIFNAVCEAGGNISSQDALGLIRIPWQQAQAGAAFTWMKRVKAIWDPLDIFNPGKVVGPAANLPIWPFQPQFQEAPPESATTYKLLWKSSSNIREASRCNGCGACKTSATSTRMCPVHKARGSELSSPRAMANLSRILQDREKPPQFSSDEMREVANNCFGCRMCVSGCPTHVDIPGLMLDARVANAEVHGMTRLSWFLSRAESLARMGSTFAPFSNWVLGNPVARWFLEKLFGVSRRRRIQPFARNSFLKIAKKRGWTQKPLLAKNKVAYLVDAFANYNDPSIAESVVEVLHHQGVEVFVPPGQSSCGMAALAQGDLDHARQSLRANLRVFGDLAREGFAILCSEPTTALFLTQDASRLVDDPDVELVASRVIDFNSFLWNLHQEGQLKDDFQNLNIRLANHIPCHEKALGTYADHEMIFSLIPGVKFESLPDSCSGMAGTFGLAAQNLELSLKIGEPMLKALAQGQNLVGLTGCSSCKLQMEFASNRPTFHPAQILAIAYGLIPSLQRKLDHARR